LDCCNGPSWRMHPSTVNSSRAPGFVHKAALSGQMKVVFA